jgi:hypothetical protein
VVFWNGVNGCNPGTIPGHVYEWQENAENLKSSLESYPGEFAEPFGFMARKHEVPQKVAADFDAYLHNCWDQGKVPFVVLSPGLNIKSYMATLNPCKLNPFTAHAEAAVRGDIHWTRSMTPLVLSRLAGNGYAIDGYAHSWGGTMAAQGIQAGNTRVRSLTPMNARAESSSFERLQEEGFVETLWRITTAGDALTWPGKAAFGKGDVFIKEAETQGWKDPNPLSAASAHHNVVLRPGSTQVTVEIAGKTVHTDLRSILRHEVGAAAAAPRLNESGVSMKMNVKEESLRNDEADELGMLKTDVLDERPEDGGLSWPVRNKEQER